MNTASLELVRTLAARGRPAMALAVLELTPAEPASHREATLLRARLLCQLGRFAEALPLWEKLESDGSTIEGRRGLQACSRLVASPLARVLFRARLALPRTAAALALLLILLAIIGAGRWMSPALPQTSTDASAIDRLDQRIAALSRDMEGRKDPAVDSTDKKHGRDKTDAEVARLTEEITALRADTSAMQDDLSNLALQVAGLNSNAAASGSNPEPRSARRRPWRKP